MVGFGEAVRLTHAMEHVLDQLRAKSLDCSDNVLSGLFRGLDFLKGLTASFAAGESLQESADKDALSGVLSSSRSSSLVPPPEYQNRGPAPRREATKAKHRASVTTVRAATMPLAKLPMAAGHDVVPTNTNGVIVELGPDAEDAHYEES